MLKYFFVAYREVSGPRWGSRFMKAVGILFLGSPEKKGLGHLRDDIQEQFYFCKEDRILPPPEELEEYRMHAILANEYRQEELLACSKAVFRVNGALSILVVVLVALLPIAFKGGQPHVAPGLSSLVAGTAQTVAGKTGELKGAGEPASAERCNALRELAAIPGFFTPEQLAAEQQKHPHCF